MAEGKLDQNGAKSRNWPLWRTIAAIGLVLAAAVWVLRQPIAEALGKAYCSGQGLSCQLKISRLDFGGVTIRQLAVAGPSAHTPPLTAEEIAVDLNWSSPFGVRASSVSGKGVVMRLDLTGHGPLLGDLDKTVQKFASQPPNNAPAPKLDIQTIQVIALTALGPIEADGKLAMADNDHFTFELGAAPIKLSSLGSELDLRTAEVHAAASGGTMSGAAKLDLAKFIAPGAALADVKLDVSLNQLNGALKGHGEALAGDVALKEGGVKAASGSADVEATAIDFGKPPGSWIADLRMLKVNASAGAGSLFGVGWADASLKANLDPKDGGGAAGDFLASFDRLKHLEGGAERIEVSAKLDLPPGFNDKTALSANGAARIHAGSLSKDAADSLIAETAGALKAGMPALGAAAEKALRSAGQAFDFVLPFSASVGEGGVSLGALSGAELSAKSGLSLVLDGESKKEVVRWSSGATGWTAAGSARLSGGGGPQLSLEVTQAQGAGARIAAAGDAELHAWRVGEDTLSGKLSGFSFRSDASGGQAAGELALAATGYLAGGEWTKVEAGGALTALWSDKTFLADAPQGLTISWDKAQYGATAIGAGALSYLPKGRFGERKGDIIAGEGAIAALDVPVTGADYAARAKLGATNLNWTMGAAKGGELKIAFNSGAPGFSFSQHDTPAPNPSGSFTGLATLSGETWRLSGGIDGAVLKADQATIDQTKAKFDVSGGKGALAGKLSDVSLSISDPSPTDKRAFEAAKFAGKADLSSNIANFSGAFTLAKSGVQLANVSGSHNLKTGSGSLTFAPTPLIFSDAFKPLALSPLLRGPADVSGRIDISGGASWTKDGFRSNAEVNLQKIGFTLATAGVFEGVSGKVAISDVLKMTSDPHQTITLDKVTLGLPIEKGAIKFQLIGYDAIRLEGAEWPFVGGFIRIAPVDFSFSAPQNTIIADAVNWDMAQLVDLFKLKDIKLQGQISGVFPVSFSTGSARVDKALLQASSKGGVIQYTGSTGDAAGQSDSKAKMLFDALKDFRYDVLKAQLDGDLAGEMVLAVTLQGRNPSVLNGQLFNTTITLDSELAKLLNTTNAGAPKINALIGDLTGGAPN